MTTRKKIALIVAAALTGGLLLLLLLDASRTAPEATTAPLVEIPTPAPTSEPVPVPVNEPVDEQGTVDVEDFDLTGMNITYEALAVVSAYFHITDGDIETSARDAVLANASSQVRRLFADHWPDKQALSEQYPSLSVFTDVQSISDVPSSDADVAIAILFDVYRTDADDSVSLLGTQRWKIHFTLMPPADTAATGLDWRISGVDVAIID